MVFGRGYYNYSDIHLLSNCFSKNSDFYCAIKRNSLRFEIELNKKQEKVHSDRCKKVKTSIKSSWSILLPNWQCKKGDYEF